ncbi:hypothetical protein JHK86_010038 [Glycine max]|nr:hypothetical protein JHK86_010038 [Glycine max]
MDNNPWELLDIDDSDIPSFVHPSNQSSSSSTILIPGPAREPLPTQECIMRTHQVTQCEFNKNPWLHALDFVLSRGSIDYTFDHVPLTIVIVKSCTPNGFSNMRVTLKDPAGTIDATMKRTIIERQDCSPYMTNIHIGFVLVVVFGPFPPHSKCYLNITLHNVVKVMFSSF